MQQDELSRLFEQSMSFAPAPAPGPAPAPTPPPKYTPPPQQDAPKRANSEPITYISTHYHHSGHIAPPATRMASPPLSTSGVGGPPLSTSPHLDRTELESILTHNGINPSILFPSQLTLFQSADEDQRQRLLELWRIVPPTYAEHERVWESGVWPETSLEQEEAMARVRYENLVAEKEHELRCSQHNPEDAMMDGLAAMPVQPVSMGLGRSAEPYMLSGYEQLARREYEEQARMQMSAHEGMALQETTRYNQATDPVYLRPGTAKSEKGVVQDMENQYGAFEAMRQGGDGWTVADEDMIM